MGCSGCRAWVPSTSIQRAALQTGVRSMGAPAMRTPQSPQGAGTPPGQGLWEGPSGRQLGA